MVQHSRVHRQAYILQNEINIITMVPSDAGPLYKRDQKCDQTLMHTYWMSETTHPRYKKAQVSSPGNSEEVKSNEPPTHKLQRNNLVSQFYALATSA